jgi:succinate dehydrogenase/fumarate reductase flavoprotein subunit
MRIRHNEKEKGLIMDKERVLDRRSFLKAALATGAVTAAGAALAACDPGASTDAGSETELGGTSGDSTVSASVVNPQAQGVLTWLPEEPQISDADVEAEESADIVIIGLGVAGSCAARSATEEGAGVIAIEKAATPSYRSGDIAVIDGKINETWGRVGVFDHDMLADHEMDEQGYFPKRAIYKKWADNCGAVFDWFVDAVDDVYICPDSLSDIPDGVEALVYPSYYPLPEKYDWKTENYPTFPTTCYMGPTIGTFGQANWDKAVAAGARGFFGHVAEKLIVEGGKVTGVYARNAETGKYLKATATKAVILSSGEYSSNEDILGYYCPETIINKIPHFFSSVDLDGNMTNTGDGLKMGAWINAAIQEHHPPMIHYMGVGGIGTSPYLRLNVLGKRFMNEDVPGQQIENQIEGLPKQKMFTIWDAAWVDQLQYFQPAHGSAVYVMDELPKNFDKVSNHGIVSPTAVEDAVAGGGGGFGGAVYKANTIEELIDQLEGINKEEALKSIERYNELAKQGKDEDFGKPASRMFALENPPYYGAESGVSAMLVCPGGLVSDEDCHVYSNDGEIIPGIYAAGNIQGSRYAVAYPIARRGVSHSLCMYYGYVAGKNAASGV